MPALWDPALLVVLGPVDPAGPAPFGAGLAVERHSAVAPATAVFGVARKLVV